MRDPSNMKDYSNLKTQFSFWILTWSNVIEPGDKKLNTLSLCHMENPYLQLKDLVPANSQQTIKIDYIDIILNKYYKF